LNKGYLAMQESIKRKYGVDNASKIPWVKEKLKKSFWKSNTKRVQTNVRKYGVSIATQNEQVKKKNAEATKQFYRKNSGVENGFQTEAVKQKIKSVNLRKYGVENVMQNPQIAQKCADATQRTMLKKYGVNSAFKLQRTKVNARIAHKQRPNKSEKKILSFGIPRLVYTGNGEYPIRIPGKHIVKFPDFVYRPIHETRKVIEFFGRYFHKPEEEQSIKTLYGFANYDCLVVWQEELENMSGLQQKILQFLHP